jgi:lysophospholipase L1-like esterase
VGREEAGRRGVAFVDLTGISRRAAIDRSLIAGDGLHPSAQMYAEWARELLPFALAALG